MLHKLKQGTKRYRFTYSNRLPARRARHFLMNELREAREGRSSGPLRAAMGLLRWSMARAFHGEVRIAPRSGCFITGRARGTSQRFSVARTRIKQFSSEGRLFGVRKSSW